LNNKIHKNNNKIMKNFLIFIIAVISWFTFFSSCKRPASDATYISKIHVAPVKYITSDTLCGTLQGTLQPGKKYYLTCPITILAGDTLKLESGDTIDVVNPAAYILVQGVFLSIGTQSAPNWITVSSITKQDNLSTAASPATDPAFVSTSQWCGIQCDTACPLCVLKWTHVEFVGANFSTPPISSLKAGAASWAVYFTNPNGNLIFEDSWVYGTVDDGIRIASGNLCIMRSTFEKISYTGGDCLNAKHGAVGIMAYNLFVGTCYNGTKASDKGSGAVPTCQVDMYNNTYVNGGFRQNSITHGSDIDYEQGAYGQAYNNLIVNCKLGLRVVGSPVADTAQLYYGYIYNYADSLDLVDQFYPVGNVTKPEPGNIPNPDFLPAGYTLGAAYSAPQNLAGANNPLFVNYPLPCPSVFVIDYASGFDFHLQGSSPAVGAGNTSWSPMPNPVPVDPVFGATLITPPGKDIGCYQVDNSGNQH
jgi:hypothetical protein